LLIYRCRSEKLTLASDPGGTPFQTDELHAAVVLFEESDRSFRHHQTQMLPLVSPPPYTLPDQRASTSISPDDDYRCTISPQGPDLTVVHISIHIHIHLDTDRIPCWRVRRKLIALDQPICAHRCTSDPAFFRSVRRRRMNTLCISFGSREYLPFFGRWTEKSRVWKCREEGCNMSAWISGDRDTGCLRLHARTFWAGELEDGDGELLEVVKKRAQEGGGLICE
jgi:hypothetical protein